MILLCITDFLNTTISGIISGVLVGCFFNIFENINRQKIFVATLRSLMAEFTFNSIHRGNSRAPFQTVFLEKALLLTEFHDQCPDQADQCSEIFELCKDANSENLLKRAMTPSDLQSRMKLVNSKFKELLPSLRGRAEFLGCVKWIMLGI